MKTNNFGTQLIQVCQTHSLQILNGRWGPHSNRWTHFTINSTDSEGGSVTDWAIVNQVIMNLISDYEIEEDIHFSDHAELKVKIKVLAQPKTKCTNIASQPP